MSGFLTNWCHFHPCVTNGPGWLLAPKSHLYISERLVRKGEAGAKSSSPGDRPHQILQGSCAVIPLARTCVGCNPIGHILPGYGIQKPREMPYLSWWSGVWMKLAVDAGMARSRDPHKSLFFTSYLSTSLTLLCLVSVSTSCPEDCCHEEEAAAVHRPLQVLTQLSKPLLCVFCPGVSRAHQPGMKGGAGGEAASACQEGVGAGSAHSQCPNCYHPPSTL